MVREFWVRKLVDVPGGHAYSRKEIAEPVDVREELIHVREVQPGSIQITREMLREVVADLFLSKKIDSTAIYDDLERELFDGGE